MKEKLKIALALMLVILYSCETDFVMEEQAGEAKMVINCNLDDVWKIKVYVTESFTLKGNTQIKSIPNASVELYQNDVFVGILPFLLSDSSHTFGGYEWTEKPVPGNKYSVRVSHPKYGVVTAEDMFPLKPAVNAYEILHYGNEANSYITKFRIRFQDETLEENFYRLNIWQTGEQIFANNGDTVIQPYQISCYPVAITELTDTVRDYGINLLFSDRNFNGENKDLIIEFNTIDLQNVKQGNLFVIFGQASKAHYNYFKTLAEYKNNDLGSSPTAVFSNVNNGYGIMMGHCIYRMTIPVK